MNWTERIEQYIREGRPVSGGKGDHSAAEQQNADALRQQELGLMQQQLNMQLGQISSVNKSLDPMIAAGGLNPQTESALRSIALNQLPANFQSLTGQIGNQLTARGISGGQFAGGSGDIARNFGQLGAMQNYMQSQALSNVQLDKQQALMQELGMKLGIGGMFGQNVGTFNSGGVNALNAGVTAANNADQASTGFWGSLAGALTSPFSFGFTAGGGGKG